MQVRIHIGYLLLKLEKKKRLYHRNLVCWQFLLFIFLQIIVQIFGSLEASDNISDYSKDRRHWILFNNVQNLVVGGGGVINGNGKIWWQNSCKTNISLVINLAYFYLILIFRATFPLQKIISCLIVILIVTFSPYAAMQECTNGMLHLILESSDPWSNGKVISVWPIVHRFERWKQPLMLALGQAVYITFLGVRHFPGSCVNVRNLLHQDAFFLYSLNIYLVNLKLKEFMHRR